MRLVVALLSAWLHSCSKLWYSFINLSRKLFFLVCIFFWGKKLALSICMDFVMMEGYKIDTLRLESLELCTGLLSVYDSWSSICNTFTGISLVFETLVLELCCLMWDLIGTDISIDVAFWLSVLIYGMLLYVRFLRCYLVRVNASRC